MMRILLTASLADEIDRVDYRDDGQKVEAPAGKEKSRMQRREMQRC